MLSSSVAGRGQSLDVGILETGLDGRPPAWTPLEWTSRAWTPHYLDAPISGCPPARKLCSLDAPMPGSSPWAGTVHCTEFWATCHAY